MTIPDFQTIMRPIMSMLADGQTRSAKEIIASVADQYGLTEEERSELIPSGTQRRIDNKVHGSLTHMVQAGLLERPMRAHVRITDQGRSALDANPERIDMTVLRTYPSYVEFRERTREKKPAEPKADQPEAPAEASPQDLIDAATAENQAAVEGELLIRALALTPREFELLVVRLL